jgi:hypothetical protein
MSGYNLTISSTLGGSVHATFGGQEEMIGPGETDTLCSVPAGATVALVANPQEAYRFASWVGDVDTMVNLEAAETSITVNGHYYITAGFDDLPRQGTDWALIAGITAPIVVGLLVFLVRRRAPIGRRP